VIYAPNIFSIFRSFSGIFATAGRSMLMSLRKGDKKLRCLTKKIPKFKTTLCNQRQQLRGLLEKFELPNPLTATRRPQFDLRADRVKGFNFLNNPASRYCPPSKRIKTEPEQFRSKYSPQAEPTGPRIKTERMEGLQIKIPASPVLNPSPVKIEPISPGAAKNPEGV